MSDLIDRQAAIRIASGYCHPANIAKELENLPSAQPERKTGKWEHEIDTGAVMLKCSACECRVIELEYKTAVGLQGFTYCPYCGAKMEEDDGK